METWPKSSTRHCPGCGFLWCLHPYGKSLPNPGVCAQHPLKLRWRKSWLCSSFMIYACTVSTMWMLLRFTTCGLFSGDPSHICEFLSCLGQPRNIHNAGSSPLRWYRVENTNLANGHLTSSLEFFPEHLFMLYLTRPRGFQIFPFCFPFNYKFCLWLIFLLSNFAICG